MLSRRVRLDHYGRMAVQVRIKNDYWEQFVIIAELIVLRVDGKKVVFV